MVLVDSKVEMVLADSKVEMVLADSKVEMVLASFSPGCPPTSSATSPGVGVASVLAAACFLRFAA